MLKKTKFESYLTGMLADGCRLCVKGEKSVLFVTGLCSQNCYYCSLSDNKKNKDKIIINEWEIKSDKDILEEVRLCSSKGAGITGGDPLLVLGKTLKLINLLKKTFGKKFHLHLYTPLKLVTEQRLSELYKAGLDEIRFHPDVDDDRFWERLSLSKKYDWDVGVEIPSLPNKLEETKRLIDFIAPHITFLNINELELSDNNFQDFEKEGYVAKDETSYAIKESLETSKELAKHAIKNGIRNIHVCTATLKDKYQLRNRILKRSKKARKAYDYVTPEGMLVRGAIYYDKKEPARIILWLIKEFNVPKKLLDADIERKRILTRTDVVEKLRTELKSKKLKPAIVEEYPTHDCFPVEIEYL